jgi:coproporphyrinogen III oxidase
MKTRSKQTRYSAPGKIYDPVFGITMVPTSPSVPTMHSKVRTLQDMSDEERQALSERYGAPIKPC